MFKIFFFLFILIIVTYGLYMHCRENITRQNWKDKENLFMLAALIIFFNVTNALIYSLITDFNHIMYGL